MTAPVPASSCATAEAESLLSTCCDDRSAAVITGNASELTSATVAGVVDEEGIMSLVPAPTA